MTKADAEELFSLVSLIHRRLATAHSSKNQLDAALDVLEPFLLSSD